MSMNLTCNKCHLWQTPTHITYMCMMTANGVASELKGKKAIRALRIYSEWVKSTATGVYTDAEKEYVEEKVQAIRAEIEKINEIIDNPPDNLEVSYI